MKYKDLMTQHPDYDAEVLETYPLLYEGGTKFLENVEKFLPKRAAESSKLYQERLKNAFYIGYVGPIIDFFISNLFALNAEINEQGSVAKSLTPFYSEFMENVDLKETNINEFFKNIFTDVLKLQRAHIMVDFPRLPEEVPLPLTKKDEEDLNLNRAYLCYFPAESLIDWQYTSEIGNYKWVKFYTKQRYKESFDSSEVIRHTWCIYTETEYFIYEIDEDKEKKVLNEGDVISLKASGLHSMSKFNRVPVYTVEVKEGLWVMNKLASIQTALFRLDCGLDWKEQQSHYAMPVITLKDGNKFNQKLGESYYIKLQEGETFDWTEPSGNMMEISLKRRQMLMEELHRSVQQLSLSVKQTKSQTRQSGHSKEEDRHSTEVVLRAFGDIVRTAMQSLLNWVSAARGEDIQWDVSGFKEFDTESITEKLAQVLQLRAINIHSETFNKELEKSTVDFYFEDKNHETKEQIKKEIDDFDFSGLIENPLDAVFSQGTAEGVKYQEQKPQGSTKPNQQGQKPNGTVKNSKPQPKGSKARPNIN